jgi:hypothetical protein
MTGNLSDDQNPTFTSLIVTTLTNLHINTNVSGTLAVGNQNVQQKANLNVYGPTTLSGNLTIEAVNDSGYQALGSLDVSGTTTLHGGLTVAKDQATTLGSLTVKGALTLQTGGAVSAFSSDTGLSPGDNQTVPTQLAVKGYVDGQVGVLNQAIGQKATLGGSATQDFTTQNLTVNGSLKTTGSVGIGVTEPVAPLDIHGSLVLRTVPSDFLTVHAWLAECPNDTLICTGVAPDSSNYYVYF